MTRAFHAADPRGAGQRLALAIAIGALGWFLTPDQFSTPTRMLIAWVSASLTLLVVALVIIVRADADETRRRAAAEDPGRKTVWLVVLACSTVSLFAATTMMHHTTTLPAGEARVLAILIVATVVLSWSLTHVSFTLRYAHLFYRGDGEGGLTFPGAEEPDDLDFAYFAFTIGMCFQVSDVTITSRVVRRTVLIHGILSFAYNTGILALVLNLVIAQLQ